MKVEELSADSKLTIESVRYKIIISATPVDIPIQHRSVLQLSIPAYGSETQKMTRGHTALGRKERYYSMRCTSYRMKGKVLLKAFSIHDHQTQLILCRLAHLSDFPCRSKTGQRVFKLHVRTRLE